MPRTTNWAATAILAVLLVTASLADDEPQADELRAVFTRVRGAVTLTVPAAGGGVRVARALQVIPGGATITIAAGGAAALVCSTHHQILLDDRSEWSLTRDACSKGRVLSPDSYRRLAPRGGRLRHDGAILVVERSSRGGASDPLTPVLLSPRNTAVLGGRPLLRWTAVAGAVEYQIVLQGDASFIERVPAEAITCTPDPAWGDARVCVKDYPEGQPELATGGSYSLAIGARVDGASPQAVPTGEAVWRLTGTRASEIQEAARKIRLLPLAEAARQAMLAGVYMENELLADAITAYRRALELEPAAELRVSLGDAYLASGLPDLAVDCYRQAAVISDEPGVSAAIDFGLGQSHLARGRHQEAFELLERAEDSYRQLGLEEEAWAASQQAAKAKSRLRQ